MEGKGNMSKYLDEYRVGEKYTTDARTVTETDVVLFGTATGDLHPNHFDADRMKTSAFGQRIAHGMLGISRAHGFLYRTNLITESAIAFMKIEDWNFHAPVFLGDTLHAEITVKEIIPSRSKPDRGILKLFFELVKQDGTVCQSGTKWIMMKRRRTGTINE